MLRPMYKLPKSKVQKIDEIKQEEVTKDSALKNCAQLFIMIVVFINTVTLGIGTLHNLSDTQTVVLEIIDKICLAIFTLEIIIRIIYDAVHKKNFFFNFWNIFDFMIVFVSIAAEATFFTIFRTLKIARLGRAARILKSFRTIRLAKFITESEELQKVVNAIFLSIPGILCTLFLLTLILYIYAVVGVNLYGASSPEMFENMPRALFTLFQTMTLESWASGIARPLLEKHPLAWIYFVSFILVTTNIILNLLIGIVVSSVDRATQNARIKNYKDDDLQQELSKLKEQIEKIEHLINK